MNSKGIVVFSKQSIVLKIQIFFILSCSSCLQERSKAILCTTKARKSRRISDRSASVSAYLFPRAHHHTSHTSLTLIQSISVAIIWRRARANIFANAFIYWVPRWWRCAHTKLEQSTILTGGLYLLGLPQHGSRFVRPFIYIKVQISHRTWTNSHYTRCRSALKMLHAPQSQSNRLERCTCTKV